ncbi:Metal tolerance protein [Lachnellula willkommii]|uniref:Metal tolerance protein n=1 Tax=Lachnellula willkommii TaxID=215461 RepID=A0A559MDT3_9HELO|nr:Metal tolerance protein [Lachnellula willkommii]
MAILNSTSAESSSEVTPSDTTSAPRATTQDLGASSPSSKGTSFPAQSSNDADTITNTILEDPYSLRAAKWEDSNPTTNRNSILHPRKTRHVKKFKKYYNRQNALIDAYLEANDEEATEIQDQIDNGWKVKLAVYGSFSVNAFLFVIQIYAAVSTGSLSLFGTAADAFMDLVSSTVMVITSRIAAKPHQGYPVGRKRVETVGIILFCALMTTVSVELIIESGRALAAGPKDDDSLELIPLLFVGIASKLSPHPAAPSSVDEEYSFFQRIDVHLLLRSASVPNSSYLHVNVFGILMSIVGTKFTQVWFLDSVGAICIAILILSSWASTAFEHMWYLVGKSAPQDFLNKLVYVSLTHDTRIRKIDTARAYHSGDKYYVEVDVIMDSNERLQVTHDVAEKLQRKLEGLSDVERAFVHVDYEGEHNISEEHKPLYTAQEPKQPFAQRVREKFKTKGNAEEVSV